MFTTGSKFMFGSAALALIGAFFIAISTMGQSIGMAELTGPISVGYKGPVGNHLAYSILLAYAGVALLIGGVLASTRDADPEAGARLEGRETPLAVLPPRGTNHWPLVGAFGTAMVILGLVDSPILFILGLIVVGVSALQWTVYDWADRATADPYANRNIRHQLLYPMDFPLFPLVAIFLFVFSISRILLALPDHIDTAVFGGVPFVAFVIAIILSLRPKSSKNVITGLTVAGAVTVLILGVVGLAQGPKTIEKHENAPHLYDIPGAGFGGPEAPDSAGSTGEEN